MNILRAFRHRRAVKTALSALNNGQPKTSQEILSRVLASDPNHFAARLYCTLAHAELGDLAEAERTLQPTSDANPDDPIVLMVKGELSMKRGDYASALPFLEKAARQDFDNGRLYYDLGVACLALNKMDAAFLHFEKAIKLERSLVFTRLLLAAETYLLAQRSETTHP